MSEDKKNVAMQMVQMLADAGVKHLYAITGDSLNPVNNAVRIDGRIKWIHMRHEESGAFAASAEAQLTGKLAACAGSSGPGHVHLINGLYDAHRSYAPVVALASACASTQFGTCYFQETNTVKLFDDLSYYNRMPSTPVQAQRMLQQAMQTAISRGGVCVCGIPGDVADQPAADYNSAAWTLPTRSSTIPCEEQLKQVADVINKGKKVCLYCGSGCAQAHDEMMALARKLNAPVGTTFKSKMWNEYDNPNYVGLTGLLGTQSCYRAMHEADVLLILGADFPFTEFMPEDNTIIQIDIRPENLGRRARVKYGLHGDMRSTLAALLPMIEQKTDDKFLREMLDDYQKVLKQLEDYVKDPGTEDNIMPEYVITTINRMADKDAIFTVDTGMNNDWAARYLHATGPRRMIASCHHGTMANAMPQAIGAALACPDKQIISLSGDGGISMLMGDLATIAQYKLPIKIIVFNNRALGMVKLEMEVAGLPDWETNMVNPDFGKLVESMGILGLDVHKPEQLEDALKTAFEHDGPALVSVFTNPNALAMPPKITWSQLEGFSESMLKLLALGRREEVLETIRSNEKYL